MWNRSTARWISKVTLVLALVVSLLGFFPVAAQSSEEELHNTHQLNSVHSQHKHGLYATGLHNMHPRNLTDPRETTYPPGADQQPLGLASQGLESARAINETDGAGNSTHLAWDAVLQSNKSESSYYHLENGGYSQGYARISNAFVNQEERSGQAVKEDSEGKGLPKHENVYSDYELVIARFNEDISWLEKIPAFWRITIYNKGGEDNPVPAVPNRSVEVLQIPNRGREVESYMHHIFWRYSTLAEYTVFTQAWPFIHSPYFVELMNSPELLRPVQCMSLYYRTESENPDWVTPTEVVETYRKHPYYRSERFSLRTLDSIYFNDKGAANIGREYLEMYGLKAGTNIIAHVVDVIGAEGWVPHEAEIGSFAYGGLFGVHRDKILQHSRYVYMNWMASAIANDLQAWVSERVYLILFGGPNFMDE